MVLQTHLYYLLIEWVANIAYFFGEWFCINANERACFENGKNCWNSKITFLLGDICSLVTFVRSDICANNIYANDISAKRQLTVSPSIRSHLPRQTL